VTSQAGARGRGSGRGAGVLALAAALTVSAAVLAPFTSAGSGGLAAQEPGDTLVIDTLSVDPLVLDTVPVDSLSAQELARDRISALFQSLERGPGAPPDSLRTDTVGSELGEQPVSTFRAGSDSILAQLRALPGYEEVRYEAAGAEFNVGEGQLLLFGERGVPGRVRPPAVAPPGPGGDTTGAAVPPDSVVAREPPDSVAQRPDTVLAELPDSLPGGAASGDSIPEGQMGHGAGESPEGGGGARARLTSVDGDMIEATDTIRLDQRARSIRARGDPTYTPSGQGDPVSSDSLTVDIDERAASAFGANTEYAQQGSTKWLVEGNLPLVRRGVTYGSHTTFTSCELEEPHYHFESDELKIVSGNILVARPVRLYFADVPVGWLPFIAQSLAEGRSSGLLTPRFSINDIVRTNSGYRRRIENVGFYWAMSEYTDATLAFEWFDDRYTAVSGEFEYRWLRQFLEGNLRFRRFWRDAGSTELTLDTNHSWELSERTRFQASAAFASSSDFVLDNSFDPRELTRDIRSDGGFDQQFDWGQLSLGANRRQSLSDDRVDMTLPSINLSLNSLTFFAAPPAREKWYNNLNWNGGASLSLRTVDQEQPDSGGFRLSAADNAMLDGRLSSGFSLGAFGFSQTFSMRRETTSDVPLDSLTVAGLAGRVAAEGLRVFDTGLARAVARAEQGAPVPEVSDISETSLQWSLGFNYQRNLIGSTTITPRLGVSGRALKSDVIEGAESFVSAPNRVSFGAQLKSDLFGFYPGIGNYETIRHKLSTTVSYDWSPEVTPNDLQREVFNARAIQPTSVITLGLNQTWEAKRALPDSAPSPADAAGAASAPPDTAAADTAGVGGAPPGGVTGGGTAGGPERLPRSQIVNLLSINTSAIEYDFVEADERGDGLLGFQTTTLNNSISSDFLRGLTVSMTHDLFEDETVDVGGEPQTDRTFAPHLSQLNLNFRLDANSGVLGWLGRGGDGSVPAAEDTRTTPEDDFFGDSQDSGSLIPGESLSSQNQAASRSSGGSGRGWRASFNYALNRPRQGGDLVSQTLGMSLRMQPTPNWEMTWRTSYDIEDRSFTDHRIRLTRDLHRWEAHFNFFQTATGNWSFRFDVSLLDNRDLKFDYKQQSVPTGN